MKLRSMVPCWPDAILVLGSGTTVGCRAAAAVETVVVLDGVLLLLLEVDGVSDGAGADTDVGGAITGSVLGNASCCVVTLHG